MFSGSSGHSLAVHHGMPFTTRDQNIVAIMGVTTAPSSSKDPGGTRGVTAQISISI